jgi:dipeptidyl aminopeptidase/acylaminoacyl peptidase
MRFHRICCAVVFVLALHGAQRGIAAEDYFAFANISEAHIAPDGKQVVYTVTAVDTQKNRRDSSIWVVAVDGRTSPRRLTPEWVKSSSARWSPDGSRLAFLSTRGTGADAGVCRRGGAGADAFEERRERISMVAGSEEAGGGEPERAER